MKNCTTFIEYEKETKYFMKEMDITDDIQVKRYFEVEEFLKKYNHPYFASLISVKTIKGKLQLKYEFVDGLPINTYLNMHPEHEEYLWYQTLHLVRYLEFYNIFISDLKPEHFLIFEKNGLPQLKFVDITIDKSIATIKWAAPEQFKGIMDWKSNLYSFTLIFLSRYYSPEIVKEKHKNGENLNISSSCPFNEYVNQLLSYEPELRPFTIDDFIPECFPPLILHNEESNYNDYLEFHESLCSVFYSSKLPYNLSFQLFSRYCLKSNIIPPGKISDCKLPDIERLNISDIIKKEALIWTSKGIKSLRDEKESQVIYESIENCIKDLRNAYESWDFHKFRLIFDWLKKLISTGEFFSVLKNDKKMQHRIILEDYDFIASNLRREGLRLESCALLDFFYNEYHPEGSKLIQFIHHWKLLSFFTDDTLYYKYDELLPADESGYYKEIEITDKLKKIIQIKDIQQITALYSKKYSLNLRALLLLPLMQMSSDSVIEYIDEAITVAISQKNFYQLANLLSLRVLKLYDKNHFNYSIIIALSIEWYSTFFLVLYRWFDYAAEKNDFKTIRNIVGIYEQELNNSLVNSSEIRSIFRQIAEYYLKIESYDKCNMMIIRYIDIIKGDLPYLLTIYLRNKAHNHDFEIPANVVALINTHKTSLKEDYTALFTEICGYYNYFASSRKKEQFQRIMAIKLKDIAQSGFIAEIQDYFKNRQYSECLNYLKEIVPGEKYQKAEVFYFSGLLYIELNQIELATSCLNNARDLFNLLGLHKRCDDISAKMIEIEPLISIRHTLNWKLSLGKIFESNSIASFAEHLEHIIFNWLGLEVAIPFLYKPEIESFIPLFEKEKRYLEGMEAINFSKKFINLKKERIDWNLINESIEIDDNNSISLLQVKRAYCVPIKFTNELIGFLYLHSKNLDIRLKEEDKKELQLFLSAISQFMITVYQEENQESDIDYPYDAMEMIGNSSLMINLRNQITLLSKLSYSVLISGESGVGKELVAKALYQKSNRCGKMITVNCPNISRELFESELFGHIKGAFSGAHENKTGKIDAAEDGVVFFDEIGDMPFELQAKLLRVIEDRTYYPVGSNEKKTTNARFIFASNQDLMDMVSKKQFRSDLLARINQFSIKVPSLKEHPEDIPLLVKHFTEEFSKDNPKIAIYPISYKIIEDWKTQEWKMNIRQLKYEVFRELLQQKYTEQESGKFFTVSFDEKLSKEEIVCKYVNWLTTVLGKPAEVISYLQISLPTYYRLIGKFKENNLKY